MYKMSLKIYNDDKSQEHYRNSVLTVGKINFIDHESPRHRFIYIAIYIHGFLIISSR